MEVMIDIDSDEFLVRWISFMLERIAFKIAYNDRCLIEARARESKISSLDIEDYDARWREGHHDWDVMKVLLAKAKIEIDVEKILAEERKRCERLG